MIPILFSILAAVPATVEDLNWMPWMLGIFGAIVSGLFIILISVARNGFDKLEMKVTAIETKQWNHETRLQMVEAKTDTEDIARHILTMLRASGSEGFDVNDFKKR